jgi:PEGA domain
LVYNMRKDPGFHTFVILVMLVLAGTAAYAAVPADAADLQSGSAAGYYQIDSAPQGAEVYFDRQFIGETPVTITVYPTSPPGHTITLSLAGYQSWTLTYPRDPDPGQVIQVYTTLQPVQTQGSLIVSSTPGGALVTLDGGHGQMTPWTYTDLASGNHMIQVFLSGYQTYTTVVTVPPGGTVSIQAVLPPLTNVGVLQVISTPGGADLYVDQVYSGETATTVGNLQNGEHQVRLRLAGYQDWTGSVPVKGGATTTITPALAPLGQALTGDIQVSSIPPGGAVYLDGQYQGITPAAEHLELTGMGTGRHTLSIQLTNFQDYMETVIVNAGQITRISAVLTPAKNPSSVGNLQITSQPGGAEILIDNQYRGITPLTLSSFPAGNHTLLIRLNGYQDYQQVLTVVPGQDLLVSASLSPVVIVIEPTKSGMLPVFLIAALILGIILLRKQR